MFVSVGALHSVFYTLPLDLICCVSGRICYIFVSPRLDLIVGFLIVLLWVCTALGRRASHVLALFSISYLILESCLDSIGTPNLNARSPPTRGCRSSANMLSHIDEKTHSI